MKKSTTLTQPKVAPVARHMITSGLFRSSQVPNKKRQAARKACRGRVVAD